MTRLWSYEGDPLSRDFPPIPGMSFSFRKARVFSFGEVEKSSSTCEGTKTGPNVPSAVLEHAAGNKNGPKRSLSRAGVSRATPESPDGSNIA